MAIYRRECATYRVVKRNADRPAAEILAIQILDSAVGVLPREILEDSARQPSDKELKPGTGISLPLVAEIAVDISERHASCLASKVLEILRAGRA